MQTDAIVLHAFNYSETSRILRLATRDVGVVSVLARGARRSKARFGSALDLFAEGVAHLALKEGRDLQTLTAFDVVRSRVGLGAELVRFAGASAVAELMLRFGSEDPNAPLFDALSAALNAIELAPADAAREAGLAGAWRLVAEMGFAPSLGACSACHATLPSDGELTFNHVAGGVLCSRCARLHPIGRALPPEARASIAAWTSARSGPPIDAASARAHQRLLREFLHQHLAEAGGRPLRAFDTWEHAQWAAE